MKEKGQKLCFSANDSSSSGQMSKYPVSWKLAVLLYVDLRNKDDRDVMIPNKYFPCFVLKLPLVCFKVHDKAHLVYFYN